MTRKDGARIGIVCMVVWLSVEYFNLGKDAALILVFAAAVASALIWFYREDKNEMSTRNLKSKRTDKPTIAYFAN